MGFMKRPKAPEPTAQEIAVEQRQSRMIDEEIAETEKRLKAVSRGKLGASSLFCLLYTSPSPRDRLLSRMPSSA